MDSQPPVGTGGRQEVGPPTALADPRLMSRALGGLFLAGATIGLISLALPHAADSNDGALLTNIAAAYGGGALLLLLARRIPTWAIHLAVVAGTLLITRAIYYSGESVSYYSLWYVWISVFAFYFFRRAEALAHVGAVAIAYALLLSHEPDGAPEARWLTTVTTLLIAGVFIETLVRRVRRQAAESTESADSLAVVARAMRELSQRTDPMEARKALCETARFVASANSAALWEPARDGRTLVAAAAAGEELGATAVPFVGPPAGVIRAFGTTESVLAPASEASPELCPELREEPEAFAALWEPVIRNGASVAVLALYWRVRERTPDARALAVARLLAAEIASALQRSDLMARLDRAARTDDLSGLPNRRAWEEELPRELARAQRDGRPLCMAMLDLDGFKAINDSLGHQEGDRVLKETASAWKSTLRLTDLLARYGGDEFTVLLPDCPPEEARTLIDRLRKVTPRGLECSAGIARWNGSEDPDQFLARADAALYDAKRAGRNRVGIAS